MHGLRPPESRAMGRRRAHLLLSQRLVGPISSLIRRRVLRTRSSFDLALFRPPQPSRLPPRLPGGLRLRQNATPGSCYCSPEPLKGSTFLLVLIDVRVPSVGTAGSEFASASLI